MNTEHELQVINGILEGLTQAVEILVIDLEQRELINGPRYSEILAKSADRFPDDPVSHQARRAVRHLAERLEQAREVRATLRTTPADPDARPAGCTGE